MESKSGEKRLGWEEGRGGLGTQSAWDQLCRGCVPAVLGETAGHSQSGLTRVGSAGRVRRLFGCKKCNQLLDKLLRYLSKDFSYLFLLVLL